MQQTRDWTQLSDSTLVRYEVQRGVALITLTDPPANTYTYAMMRQLDEAILRARFDPAVQVLVLTGDGAKFFCAGANIQMLQEVDATFKYYFCMHANETLNRLEQTPKVVIAAINGHCVGGGLEIALAADIRYARRGEAKIGLPEINLGVLPGTGGTQRLARTLGRAKALELMLEGKTLSIEQALALGLLNRVSSSENFLEEVLAYAGEFVPPRRASMAAGHIKRAVLSGMEMAFAEGLSLERELQQRLFTSQDAAEGIRAYNEKRPPSFSGK
jgi:enoyl-CoA hydratase